MEDKHTSQIENGQVVAEPIAAVSRQSGLDGMLAYITDQYPSAALRWELGHRLIAEAEHDMQVRPAFELELQLRELQHQTDLQVKPDLDTFENAFIFINACKDSFLLSKASVYLTDHATVMLKIIIGKTTSSVDIGCDEYTSTIVYTETVATKMGRGRTDDMKSMKDFFKALRK